MSKCYLQQINLFALRSKFLTFLTTLDSVRKSSFACVPYLFKSFSSLQMLGSALIGRKQKVIIENNKNLILMDLNLVVNYGEWLMFLFYLFFKKKIHSTGSFKEKMFHRGRTTW